MRRAIFYAMIAGFLASAIAVKADVTITRKSSTDMGGMMSMEMNSAETYKSDRCYSETTSKMTGGMMSMLGKGKPTQTVEITRLDKGLLWKLEPEKKKYSEEALASFKEKFEDAKNDSENEKNKDEYTWTMEVTQIPTSQNINGFDCKGVIGKATGVKKDAPADTMFITYEQWMTDKVKGTSEVEEYQKNYAKAMGVDEMWAQESMATILGQYGNQFAELAQKINEAGSYPIRTIITVESPSGPDGDNSENAGGGDMMSQMSKMFGKKKTEKPSGENNGRTKSFMMTNEVLSVETNTVGDTKFEIPGDYKKK